MLNVDQLAFSFGPKQVLHNINFSLERGEIATLVGGSGSGKTTLFQLLVGLLNPDNGTISIFGQPPSVSNNVTYMTQEDLLLPWRTILQNLLLLGELGKEPTDIDVLSTRARELLQEIGLSGYESRYPHELSGGMRQLVSLARSFLQDRPVLLLDEPFSAIDLHVRDVLYDKLRDLRDRYRKTILLVTHDFNDAVTLSDRIFLLAGGSIVREWSILETDRSNPKRVGDLLLDLRQAITSYHPFLGQPSNLVLKR